MIGRLIERDLADVGSNRGTLIGQVLAFSKQLFRVLFALTPAADALRSPGDLVLNPKGSLLASFDRVTVGFTSLTNGDCIEPTPADGAELHVAPIDRPHD